MIYKNVLFVIKIKLTQQYILVIMLFTVKTVQIKLIFVHLIDAKLNIKKKFI